MLLFVYIVCKDFEEAKIIGTHLVTNNIVACANIVPNMHSIYHWQGKLVNDEETILIVKTIKDNFERLENEVKCLHSYEVPCIIGLDIVQSSADYSNWLRGNCL